MKEKYEKNGGGDEVLYFLGEVFYKLWIQNYSKSIIHNFESIIKNSYRADIDNTSVEYQF